ncbi:hypothetical protein [Streptomyces sp. NPDC097640]|uniref:hypothetical protein n=1 Tax=Streptomyces sp. NPDC097640 TaxID=3157229 RepID=UPI0033191087
MHPQSDVAERAPARLLAADEATAGPVFVDLSGRRARLLRHAGLVAGAAVLGYTALLGAGFSGSTTLAPATLVPGSDATAEPAAPAARDGKDARDDKDARDGKDAPRGHHPPHKPPAMAGAPSRHTDRPAGAEAR